VERDERVAVLRDKVISLSVAYKARVRVVYLEPPLR
jgi:hypothetical protein